MSLYRSNKGVFIAMTIIFLWSVSLYFGLSMEIDYTSPILYIMILIQTHFYTGLFITAHDAMHGTVSSNKKVNHFFGHLCATLFSFNLYHKLFPKHHEHHDFVATDKDPDYHNGNGLAWYFSFLKQYLTWQQFLLMAISFNLLQLILPTENLVLIWMLPGILSTTQLFYFGTYIPHKGNHSKKNQHKARSMKLNHFLAFISCYFFGYHYEHHTSPSTPWWQLWKKKEEQELRGYP